MAIRIPIKKYVIDESLSWEERYKRLEAHHTEETSWMFAELKKREKIVEAAVEMAKRRGWTFTYRTDVHGEQWDEVEKLIENIIKERDGRQPE